MDGFTLFEATYNRSPYQSLSDLQKGYGNPPFTPLASPAMLKGWLGHGSFALGF